MYASHEQMCIPYLEWARLEWLNEAIVFCSLRRLTTLGLPLLVTGCFGGQSGDDGDIRGPQLPDPTPGVGGDGAPLPEAPPDGCEDETTLLGLDERTAFEKAARELVGGITPPDAPFFWVDYESGALRANHSMPAQSSTLHLEVEVRVSGDDPDQAVTQIRRKPAPGTERVCDLTIVQVPVWVTLTTADSGLKVNRVAAHLSFYGPEVAQLQARFLPSQMDGSLDLSLTPKDEQHTWALSGITLFADIWLGGSSGTLSPEFTLSGPLPGTAVGGTASPPPTGPVAGNAYEISVPERWEAVGVWPRLEQCLPGVVRHVNDPVIGFSAADVQAALNSAAPFAVEVGVDQTGSGARAPAARLTTGIADLVCVDISLTDQELRFTVPASLAVTTAGAALVDTEFRLNVLASVSPASPSRLGQVRFERPFDDVPIALSRAQFEDQTRQSLATVPVEYREFWWTWFGSLSPAGASRSAVFLVTSANERQREAIERQVSEGGPGFEFSHDEAGQVLPGDVIFRAATPD